MELNGLAEELNDPVAGGIIVLRMMETAGVNIDRSLTESVKNGDDDTSKRIRKFATEIANYISSRAKVVAVESSR